MTTQLEPQGTLRQMLEEKHSQTVGKPASVWMLLQLKEKLERKFHYGFDNEVFKQQRVAYLRRLSAQRRAA